MRCAVCGSRRVSPQARLVFTGSDLWLRFKKIAGLRGRPDFKVEFGRACRDCGAVILILADDVRARLDQLSDQLSDETGPPPTFVGAPSKRHPD